MSLRISGKHMDIGDAFRARIEGRVGEIVAKYFDGGFAGHVTVTKSGSRFDADCIIHLDTGMTLQADRRGPGSRIRPSMRRPSASRSACAATSAG